MGWGGVGEGYLDLLSTREEVGERHAADARHLCVVDEAHELLHQPLRQVGVLEAVDGQAAPRVGVAVL